MKPFPYASRGLRHALLFLLVSTATGLFAAPTVTVTPGKASGIYAPGEKATWNVEIKPETGVPLPEMSYTIKKDGQVLVSEGKITPSDKPVTLTGSRDDAGVLLAQISTSESQGKAIALGGAIFAPEKIKPSVPEPADFDAFWKAKLNELAQVPLNPVLEKVENVEKAEGLDYYKVTLDNIRGTHVHGQLARPSAPGKYPAMLVLQYAGVYPLTTGMVINEVRPGWLVLNISAHDQPIAEPADFYKKLNDGELKGYTNIGNSDRETSYFLRMFLGDVRAAEYLTSRPDWDGKTLVVTGGSQGGLQALVTAGLYPKVTALIATVPAGCDTRAPLANRATSWPGWGVWGNPGPELEKIRETSRYFDGINFAARIHCPSLIAYGLIDETARPTGIAAAINVLKGPKEAIILPLGNHGLGETKAIYYRRAAEWKKAILAGQPVPPPSAN